jgi:hypothetical protein
MKVFQNILLPRLDTVVTGGTTSIFCYGYTGSGKTHTILGYGSEAGIFKLAVEEIMKKITRINKTSEESPLILQASVADVYNDEVYDLLGGRANCSLRKNSKGQLLVRGATKKHIFTEQEAKDYGADYAVVTSSLSTIHVKSSVALDQMKEMVLQHRVTGTSTEHSLSSRSHTIFRIDIVNQSLLAAVEQLEEMQSIQPALKNAYDKKRTSALRRQVRNLEKKIIEKQELINKIYAEAASKSPIGGRLVLVDLAGADSDSRTVEDSHTLSQKNESTQINYSLLSLKECIRSLTSSQPCSIPFRNSSLTRLLEEVLTPKEEKENNSVMLVNVAQTQRLKHKTINSLRYGAMFSTKKPFRSTSSGTTEFLNQIRKEKKQFKTHDPINNDVIVLF